MKRWIKTEGVLFFSLIFECSAREIGRRTLRREPFAEKECLILIFSFLCPFQMVNQKRGWVHLPVLVLRNFFEIDYIN
jgi:hypothetical protein